MSISISVLEDKGILEVIYSPDTVTPEALSDQRSLVSETISRRAIRKVLLDATSLQSFPSILTTLKHNEGVAANEILRVTKFAVVCSSIGSDERALETTGVNRGVDMKCFTSREDALSWLA